MSESAANVLESPARAARAAARVVARAESAVKNAALADFADELLSRRDAILSANADDLRDAQAANLSPPLLERLELTPARLDAAASGVREIAALPDPVGAVDDMRARPSGIQVGRMRIPLGVILIIYESRPNVTADAAALCFKAGNAAILRGGKEAARSNAAVGVAFAEAMKKNNLPPAAAQVAPPDRELVGTMLADSENIDMVIPRGGRGLIERVSREATMPVLKHSGRELPCLCGLRRRLGNGARHRRQLQDAALRGLQRDGKFAGAFGGRRKVFAASRVRPRRAWSRPARMRKNPRRD